MALLKIKKSDFAQNTAKLLLKDADGSPLLASNGKQVALTVLPMESMEWKKASQFKEEGERQILFKKEKDNPEKAENRRIALFSSVVTNWENVELETDGTFEPFDKQKLAVLLRESTDNIIEQIDTFITEKDNFLKKTTPDLSATLRN